MFIPGTYTVMWCDGSRSNIRSVRAAMKLARKTSSARFATPTCGGSHVVRATTTKTAQTVAECREKACETYKPKSSRGNTYDWTPAKATAMYKRQHGLKGRR